MGPCSPPKLVDRGEKWLELFCFQLVLFGFLLLPWWKFVVNIRYDRPEYTIYFPCLIKGRFGFNNWFLNEFFYLVLVFQVNVYISNNILEFLDIFLRSLYKFLHNFGVYFLHIFWNPVDNSINWNEWKFETRC